jgi:hypothetical protein
MKRYVVLRSKELFPGSDIIRKYTFKTMNTRDNCALLARADRQLSQDFAISRDKCDLFQKKDCFECLSPHNIAA